MARKLIAVVALLLAPSFLFADSYDTNAFDDSNAFDTNAFDFGGAPPASDVAPGQQICLALKPQCRK